MHYYCVYCRERERERERERGILYTVHTYTFGRTPRLGSAKPPAVWLKHCRRCDTIITIITIITGTITTILTTMITIINIITVESLLLLLVSLLLLLLLFVWLHLLLLLLSASRLAEASLPVRRAQAARPARHPRWLPTRRARTG